MEFFLIILLIVAAAAALYFWFEASDKGTSNSVSTSQSTGRSRIENSLSSAYRAMRNTDTSSPVRNNRIQNSNRITSNADPFNLPDARDFM